jgi:REP element-mobilizing transposase RayT
MNETFRRRHLPHWQKPNACYFITACLAGSIPASGRLSIRQETARWVGRPPVDAAARKRRRQARDRLAFARHEAWLDRTPGVCWFADTRLASIARDAICHHAGIRYDLHAYVVMPSHVHLVLSPRSSWSAGRGPASGRLGGDLGAIMHALKSFIAHECVKARSLQGAFWQSESYDRVVRDERELEHVVRYVEWNPVKAGLCGRPEEWAFSSAAGRCDAEEGRRS